MVWKRCDVGNNSAGGDFKKSPSLSSHYTSCRPMPTQVDIDKMPAEAAGRRRRGDPQGEEPRILMLALRATTYDSSHEQRLEATGGWVLGVKLAGAETVEQPTQNKQSPATRPDGPSVQLARARCASRGWVLS